MCDILIIGSGLAGLSAAIQCAEKGRRAVIISSQPSSCSQSVLAAGGINAALNHGLDDDSTSQHEIDTWEAGCRIADREAVHNLAENASSVIKFLEECGVIFSRDEDGKIAQRYFGGQKKKRTCYSNANIGKQLVSGLEQRVRYYESKGLIELMEHHIFLNVIKEDDEIKGVVVFDRFKGELLALEGPVIAASGGMSGLFGSTTGSDHSDGTVTAAAYLSGAKMANLEMIQYHPTTVTTKSKNMLVSEAARGEGGRLFAYRNKEKWYFCEERFGERGNLMPRDIVSRAIYKVLNGNEADKAENVWLDLTQLDKTKIEHTLGEVRTMCLDYLGIDPANEPIPVVPGIHYFMGGIWVDINHRSSVKGLYAAGECCSQYHGANRLGGNSTLGAVYGGKCAAMSCCIDYDNEAKIYSVNSRDVKQETINQLMKYSSENGTALEKRKELQDIMNKSMGIVRNEELLTLGKEKISKLIASDDKRASELEASANKTVNLMDIFSFQTAALTRLADAMLQSALNRKESRGAHYREDFPNTDDSYASPTFISL